MTEKEEEEYFHNNRVAFLIINDEILFLEKSDMSHREWFNTLNIDMDFNTIVRGFLFNNRIVMYKADFTFDDNTIEVGKKYYPVIVEKYNLNNPELWFGQIKKNSVRPISDPWPPIKRII